MRGRDNSQELFGVDWDAAEEMPESCCALLCWVILAGGCKRRDKFMDSKWLSVWVKGGLGAQAVLGNAAWWSCCGRLEVHSWRSSFGTGRWCWPQEHPTELIPLSALLCSPGWQLYPLPNAVSAEQTEHRWPTWKHCSRLTQHLIRPEAVLGTAEFTWKHLAGLCEIICKDDSAPSEMAGLWAFVSSLSYANSRVIVPVWSTSTTSHQP